MHDAEKFLDNIARQAAYRRTLRSTDPITSGEASALESFIQKRRAALSKELRGGAPKARPVRRSAALAAGR